MCSLYTTPTESRYSLALNFLPKWLLISFQKPFSPISLHVCTDSNEKKPFFVCRLLNKVPIPSQKGNITHSP